MAINFGSETIQEIIIVQNQKYEPVTLPKSTGGMDPVVYSLTPGLPEGVSFNPNTRILSVIPTESKTRTEYTYTATDDDGATDTLNFHLTVREKVSVSEVNVDRDNAEIEEEVETRTRYITKEDETLAGIIFRHYGIANQDILREVLDINSHLSNTPLVIEQGITIVLPEISVTREIEPIALWT